MLTLFCAGPSPLQNRRRWKYSNLPTGSAPAAPAPKKASGKKRSCDEVSENLPPLTQRGRQDASAPAAAKRPLEEQAAQPPPKSDKQPAASSAEPEPRIRQQRVLGPPPQHGPEPFGMAPGEDLTDRGPNLVKLKRAEIRTWRTDGGMLGAELARAWSVLVEIREHNKTMVNYLSMKNNCRLPFGHFGIDPAWPALEAKLKGTYFQTIIKLHSRLQAS